LVLVSFQRLQKQPFFSETAKQKNMKKIVILINRIEHLAAERQRLSDLLAREKNAYTVLNSEHNSLKNKLENEIETAQTTEQTRLFKKFLQDIEQLQRGDIYAHDLIDHYKEMSIEISENKSEHYD
jgi:molecular chaperone GrpE (heat shock protein)